MVALELGDCLACKIFLGIGSLSFHFVSSKIKLKNVHNFVIFLHFEAACPPKLKRSWQ